MKILIFLKKNLYFQGFEVLKINKKLEKIDETSMQLWSRKIKSQKSRQNWIWEGLGLHLGGGWDGLGRLLSTFDHFLVVFLMF